jgi:predicted O-methyltransferase YrrM
MATEPHYYSHVPVLKGLAKLLEIRRVLELGSGHFSTGTFLDRECFPNLELLCTVENDWNWYGQIREKYGDDPRFCSVCYGGDMVGAVRIVWKGTTVKVPVPNYDLIFIDDSVKPNERAATIREVVQRYNRRHTVVVIHDFETPAYQKAAKSIPSQYVYSNPPLPSTGVLWDKASLTVKEIERVLS